MTLNNPGSPVSGTISLSASTTGDATSVTFSRSPAGAATWTTIGTDGSAPYGASFNTTSVGDGLYDLRAVVTDAVGNTSQSLVGGIRVDNFIPIVVSSVPSNGAIVASASQIAITASEDIASLTGVTLDGAAAAAPTISGPTATFNTGALANGTHTLAGTVRDAAGNSSAFSITFMVGVPAPPPAGGGDTGGTFGSVLPLVPAPHDFRGVLESDGSLTLRWTPAQNAKGQPFATILFVDGIAKQTFAPGEDEVNLGQFDSSDMRVFSIASVDADGHASPTSQQLRSTSRLAGKTLDEATAILRDRGFELGAVRGTGTVVSEPVVAPLGSKIDLELGQGLGALLVRRRRDEAVRAFAAKDDRDPRAGVARSSRHREPGRAPQRAGRRLAVLAQSRDDDQAADDAGEGAAPGHVPRHLQRPVGTRRLAEDDRRAGGRQEAAARDAPRRGRPDRRVRRTSPATSVPGPRSSRRSARTRGRSPARRAATCV